jgi:type VI protein secretion system component VasF
MELAEYPVASLSFTGIGAVGATVQAAAEALATSLTEWAQTQQGRRLLQLTVVSPPPPLDAAAAPEVGLVALLVHTAGPELPEELAEQVAAVVEEAEEALDEAVVNTDTSR